MTDEAKTIADLPAASLPLASGALLEVQVGTGSGASQKIDAADLPINDATQAALDDKADLVGGVIPTSQLPALAVTEYLGTVANESGMLALTGQKGDWTVRTDTGSTWFISGDDPTQLASWTSLSYPAAPVTSVNGQAGSVTLGKSDIGLGNVDNTADTAKPISTLQQAALDAKAPLADGASARNTVTAVTSASGVANLNYALGDYFTLALTENITSLTFSNLPGAGKGCTIMLRITQHASSAKTMAWPSSFKWAGGSAGAVSTTLSAVDVLAMTTFDNGTTWRVTLAKGFA